MASGRTLLKSWFETGDIPTQAQFAELIDSIFNLTDDAALLEGLTLPIGQFAFSFANHSFLNTGDRILSAPTAPIMLLNAAAGVNIHGMSQTTWSGADVVMLYNTGSNAVSIKHSSVLAGAGEEFRHYAIADYVLPSKAIILVTYVDGGWVIITGYQQPGGGGSFATITGVPGDNAALAGVLATKADLVGGLVPATQLPSYVDDVIERANLAAFPTTGETGKIYLALDTNRQYRWSGSVYVELVASPGTTDAILEGSTNLFFTAARVRSTLLTGLTAGSNALITATDTVLSAFQNLQAQISHFWDNTNKVLTILGAFPKLRLGTTGNSNYATFERTTGNLLRIKNQVTQAGGFGKCVKFNSASSSSITVDATGMNANSFSVSFWFRTTNSGMVWFRGNIASNRAQFFQVNNATAATVWKDVAGTGSGSITVSGINMLDGNWHHVVQVISSTNVVTYVDNVSYTSSFTAATNGTSPFTLGAGDGVFYNGYLDQFVCWNSSLTAGNVATIWNSGAGTATLPGTPTRRLDFEEGTGSTTNESVNNSNYTLVNGVSWDNNGKTPVSGVLSEATILSSEDGLTGSENGIQRVGDFNGRTEVQGKYIHFFMNNFYPLFSDAEGNIIIDQNNTGTTPPTAKLNAGAPTLLRAGLRLLPGVLNTSNINLGDTNHVTSQRTFFKRKGATTPNSIWLSEIDTLFTQPGTVTVTATTTASTLLAAFVSGNTSTLPPNFFSTGKTIEVEIEGTISNVATETILFELRLGSTNLLLAGAVTLSSAFSQAPFMLKVKLKCVSVGATGTFHAVGDCRVLGATEQIIPLTKTATTTIDTTLSQVLNVLVTWGSNNAGNTITSYLSSAKILN